MSSNRMGILADTHMLKTIALISTINKVSHIEMGCMLDEHLSDTCASGHNRYAADPNALQL